MEITLEQVERLREKADVSYGQAKAALEYSGGNLLDALIYLEEQGVIPRPEDAYYSTKNEAPPPPPQELPVLQVKPEAKQAKQKKHKRRGVRHLLHWLRRILLDNELEIWRKGQPITAVPMLILLIFVIFLYCSRPPGWEINGCAACRAAAARRRWKWQRRSFWWRMRKSWPAWWRWNCAMRAMR